MRILWITENYYPNKGGMAHSCDRIVTGLRDHGVNIDLIHLVKHKRRPIVHASHGKDISWPLGEDPSHNLRCCWSWIEQQANYDLVVAFGFYYALIGAQTYAAWLSAKLVTLVRGNDFDTGIFDFKRRALLKDVYLSSTRVICISADKAELIKRLFPSVKVCIVANGIDSDQWKILPSHRQKLEVLKQNLPADKLIIGLVGHLKEKKGVLLLAEAVIKSGLSDCFHLLLIGEVQPQLGEQLNNMFSQLSYSTVPFIDRFQLIPYYLACDLLAIPSYYDGMPNVLLEAGTLGIPIIASNTGGMADMLSHNHNSLLFPPGNEAELRRLLHIIHNSPFEHFAALGQQLANDIKTGFTHKRETLAYLNCFKEIINEINNKPTYESTKILPYS